MAEPDGAPVHGGRLNGHPALDHAEPDPDPNVELLATLDAVRLGLVAVAGELSKLAGMGERIEHIDNVLREFEPIIRRMADNPAARFMQRTRGGT